MKQLQRFSRQQRNEKSIMKNRCRKNQFSGITLVELLVVVAIGGILLAIAGPSFTSMTQGFRVKAETSSFFSDLNLARSEAIKRGTAVTMCASSDQATCLNGTTWNTGWIIFTPTPGALTTVPANSILKKQAGWKKTDTLKPDTTSNATYIAFGSEGFAAGPTFPASGLITFKTQTTPVNDDVTQCAEINKAGRIQTLKKGQGSCT